MKNPTEFIENIIKQIVNYPEEVKVGETGSVLEITANPADLGTVIGKGGKNIRSLKNLLNLKTAREGLPRLDLVIHEEKQTI